MKKLVYFATTLLAASSLVSCGNKPSTSDVFVPALDTNTHCKIKIVGEYGNFEALEAEFDRFNQYYPDVELSYSKIDDYDNSIALALEREDKPNIYFTYAFMVGDSKYDSVFAHADNLSNPDLNINLDCIRPSLLNHDSQGNVLMVPVFSRTHGALVNQDLFNKEGIKIPTTWDELISACDSFYDKGYKSPMMGYSLKNGGCLMYSLAYPQFIADLIKTPGALDLANALDPAAGEYMRTSLEKVKALVDGHAIDIAECNKINDNYDLVLKRFLDGDVPMMICGADTPSGITKRMKTYQPYLDSPFNLAFYPIPMTNDGGYFIDSPSIQFSINKNCNDLDMTREFMRFLVRNEELNNIAAGKGLVSTTKEMPLNSLYGPFGQIPAERTLSPEILGVTNGLTIQIRVASFKVGTGNADIDTVISEYGTYK